MAFLEILKELVEGAPAGVAAVIMGTDGLAVRQYAREGARYDVETVGIEYGRVMDEISHASALLDLGTVEEVTVLARGANLMLRMLTPDYYLAFVMDGPANVAKARYLLKRASARARKELLA